MLSENSLANGIAAAHIFARFMPTYEYVCPKCHHEFELFQSMRDEPLKKCPKCKKAGVRRLVGGGAGLIFKGSGFYITDYKNKPAGAKAEGGKSDAGSSDKSSPAKTETKTEAKTDSKSASKPAADAAK